MTNCSKCLAQSLPFTELEDEEFEIFTADSNQQITEEDLNRLQNMTFNPFSNSVSTDISSERDFDLYQNINDNMMQCDYYVEDKFKQEISKRFSDKPHFSLFHLNARSVINKIDDLQQYLTDIAHKFSVIGISETWLDTETESLVHLPDYTFVNTNRKLKNGGGAGMFISSSINYSVRNDLNLLKEDVFESIFVEARLNTNDNIIIGTIYKPPNNNYDDFETQLKTILYKIDKEKKTCILMGDFNIDLLKYEQNNNANKFIHQMYSSHFYPVINKPTRITTTAATIIDNIFINNVNVNSINGILINDLSDHLPVFQLIPLKTTETKIDKLYKKRLITKRNIEKLRDEMRNTNWENLQSINDADDAYKCFREFI